MLKSLIWKNRQIEPVINPKNAVVLTEDLNLKKILSIMSKEPMIKMTPEIFLNAVTSDVENILYRQCILKDFLKRNDIVTTLEEIVALYFLWFSSHIPWHLKKLVKAVSSLYFLHLQQEVIHP